MYGFFSFLRPIISLSSFLVPSPPARVRVVLSPGCIACVELNTTTHAWTNRGVPTEQEYSIYILHFHKQYYTTIDVVLARFPARHRNTFPRRRARTRPALPPHVTSHACCRLGAPPPPRNAGCEGSAAPTAGPGRRRRRPPPAAAPPRSRRHRQRPAADPAAAGTSGGPAGRGEAAQQPDRPRRHHHLRQVPLLRRRPVSFSPLLLVGRPDRRRAAPYVVARRYKV
jgi:hypothetical protein